MRLKPVLITWQDHAKNKQTKKNVFMNSIVIFCVHFETTVEREAILKNRANLEEDIHAFPKAFLLLPGGWCILSLLPDLCFQKSFSGQELERVIALTWLIYGMVWVRYGGTFLLDLNFALNMDFSHRNDFTDGILSNQSQSAKFT